MKVFPGKIYCITFQEALQRGPDCRDLYIKFLFLSLGPGGGTNGFLPDCKI